MYINQHDAVIFTELKIILRQEFPLETNKINKFYLMINFLDCVWCINWTFITSLQAKIVEHLYLHISSTKVRSHIHIVLHFHILFTLSHNYKGSHAAKCYIFCLAKSASTMSYTSLFILWRLFKSDYFGHRTSGRWTARQLRSVSIIMYKGDV